MERKDEKSNSFLRLYALSPNAPVRSVRGERRIVFASWAAVETAEGHAEKTAVETVREELMRSVACGERPVLCLYAGEDPAWFAEKGGWLKEDNLRCYLRYVGKMVRALGHLTDEYITLFEPNELVWSSREVKTLPQRLRMLSHMACVHVRAVRLIRDTRTQRSLGGTRVGFVLRMFPAIDLRRGLLLGKNAATASPYEVLPLLAMAKGEFLPPLRNVLRIRPGAWADFVGVSGGGGEKKQGYCCRTAATLTDAEIWEVTDTVIPEDTENE